MSFIFIKAVHNPFDFLVDFVDVGHPGIDLGFRVFSVLGEFFDRLIFLSLFGFHL